MPRKKKTGSGVEEQTQPAQPPVKKGKPKMPNYVRNAMGLPVKATMILERAASLRTSDRLFEEWKAKVGEVLKTSDPITGEPVIFDLVAVTTTAVQRKRSHVMGQGYIVQGKTAPNPANLIAPKERLKRLRAAELVIDVATAGNHGLPKVALLTRYLPIVEGLVEAGVLVEHRVEGQSDLERPDLWDTRYILGQSETIKKHYPELRLGGEVFEEEIDDLSGEAI